MEFQRLILIVAIAFVGLMLYNAWQHDYARPTPKAVTQTTKQAQSTPATSVTQSAAAPLAEKVAASPISKTGKLVSVATDVLNVKIDTIGGNIVFSSLPKYPKSLQTPDQPVVLMNNDPNSYYVAQSILANARNVKQNDSKLVYASSQTAYELGPQQKQLEVILKGTMAPGIEIDKIYTFTAGSNLIRLRYEVKNTTGATWQGQLLTQLSRKPVQPESSGFFHIHPYMGTAISSPEKRYQKLSFKDIKESNLDKLVQGGWAAMVQHYFLSAWVPGSQQQNNRFFSAVNQGIYTIGFAGPAKSIAPNSQQTFAAKLYTGPEIASVLKNIAPGLELTVSYGWLWFISVIIFWVMEKIHYVVGNWGWSIILVTVFIKLLFYHLSAKSYSSMAKMRQLQPRIEALKERFGDDRQKMSQATMELYKKEKVNPLGGCLPILVQIPVFFALYMVLIESVQLRQAPWILCRSSSRQTARHGSQ